MRLFVLAGGFGTRLKTVTGDMPKVLAPVCGLPFLHYQIENWVSQGVTEFVFLLHYQAEVIINYIESELVPQYEDCTFKWITEEHPLGTGGAIANAIRKMDVSNGCLVVNADTWLGSGIQELINSGPEVMAITRFSQAQRYGSVKINKNGLVQGFHEKNEKLKAGLINAGLYFLSQDIFLAQSKNDAFSMENDILPSLVARNVMKSIILETDFIDIGIPDDYRRFNDWILRNRSEQLWS